MRLRQSAMVGLLGAVALSGLPAASAAAPAEDQYLLMRRVASVDPGAFGRP